MKDTDPRVYVLDKALNYGNSGGPIVAVASGRAHGICSRFQPVEIPQPHGGDDKSIPRSVMIPSLYGIVSNLLDPRISKVLSDRKIRVYAG